MADAQRLRELVVKFRNDADAWKQAGRRYEAVTRTHPEAIASARDCYGKMAAYDDCAQQLETALNAAPPTPADY